MLEGESVKDQLAIYLSELIFRRTSDSNLADSSVLSDRLPLGSPQKSLS